MDYSKIFELIEKYDLNFLPIWPRDKKPMLGEWSKYQLEKVPKEQFKQRYFSNGSENGIAIMGGSISNNLYVVDVDNINFANEVEKIIPETLTVQTRNGKHFYFFNKLAFEKTRFNFYEENNDKKELFGIDIIANKSYVVAPPSIHPSGINYEFTKFIDIKEVHFAEIVGKIYQLGIMLNYSITQGKKKEKKEKKYVDKPKNDTNWNDLENALPSLESMIGFDGLGLQPIHGSKQGNKGKNINVDSANNRWYCFHCDVGGYKIHWFAIEKLGFNDCNDINTITKDQWKELATAIREEYNLPEFRPVKELDSITSNEESDLIPISDEILDEIIKAESIIDNTANLDSITKMEEMKKIINITYIKNNYKLLFENHNKEGKITGYSWNIDKLAELCISSMKIKLLLEGDKDEIYYYNNKGVFRLGGEKKIGLFIEALAQFYPEKDVSNSTASEVINKCKRRSQITSKDFNRHFELINCANGVIDTTKLPEKVLLPHSEDYLFTIQIPTEFKEVKEDVYKELDSLLSSFVDPKDKNLLIELGAFTLIPAENMKKIICNLGDTDAGKSVFMYFINLFIGKQNTIGKTIHELTGDRFAFAELKDKLLMIDDDVSSKEIYNTQLLKIITGWKGEVSAPRKHKSDLPFNLTAKIIVNANKLPKIKIENFEDALFNRFDFIKFPYQFINQPNSNNPLEKPKDTTIYQKLQKSDLLSAYFNKVLDNYVSVKDKGLSAASSINTIKDLWRKQIDPYYAFYKEMLIEKVDAEEFKEDVYDAAKTYFEETGQIICANNIFSSQLTRIIPNLKQSKKMKLNPYTNKEERKAIWKGIEIIEIIDEDKKINNATKENIPKMNTPKEDLLRDLKIIFEKKKQMLTFKELFDLLPSDNYFCNNGGEFHKIILALVEDNILRYYNQKYGLTADIELSKYL